jgi:hypothetical protein
MKAYRREPSFRSRKPDFIIGDRVLRPALVGVSKGGPKVKPAAQQAEIDKADDRQ